MSVRHPKTCVCTFCNGLLGRTMETSTWVPEHLEHGDLVVGVQPHPDGTWVRVTCPCGSTHVTQQNILEEALKGTRAPSGAQAIYDAWKQDILKLPQEPAFRVTPSQRQTLHGIRPDKIILDDLVEEAKMRQPKDTGTLLPPKRRRWR